MGAVLDQHKSMFPAYLRGMKKPAIEGGTPVRETKIYYGHQYIDDADIQAVVDVLKSDNLTCGPKIGELGSSSTDCPV